MSWYCGGFIKLIKAQEGTKMWAEGYFYVQMTTGMDDST